MITLDSALKSLEIKLAGAATTTELPYVSSYVDINQTSFALSAAGQKDGITTGGTAVTIVSAPVATTSRKVNSFSVVNVDTVAAVLTVQLNNNATLRTLFKVTLAVGDCLFFAESQGFQVFDSSGNLKTTMQIPPLTVTNAMLAGSIAAAKLIATDFTVITASGLITGGSLSISGTGVVTGSAGFGMASSATYAFSAHGTTADNSKGAFRCEDSATNTTAYVLNNGEFYFKGAGRLGGHVAGTPTWVAGDKYLIVDASGYIHVSALGPLS